MALKLVRAKVRTARLTRVRYPEKTADPHYLSPEHKAWREAVLRRDGYRCQDAGPHGGPLHADHVVERSDGGADLDVANGLTRCQACHNRKTARERSMRAMLRPSDGADHGRG